MRPALLRSRSRRFALTSVGVAGLLAATTTVAVATPPSGTISVTNLIFGDLRAHSVARQDGITLKARPATKVAMFSQTYAVGASSGWHHHPGIVIALVESGTIVRQVGCKVQTLTAGQAFTEVAPHAVRNYYTDPSQPGAVPAVLRITQIYPANAPARRVEDQPPVCEDHHR